MWGVVAVGPRRCGASIAHVEGVRARRAGVEGSVWPVVVQVRRRGRLWAGARRVFGLWGCYWWVARGAGCGCAVGRGCGRARTWWCGGCAVCVAAGRCVAVCPVRGACWVGAWWGVRGPARWGVGCGGFLCVGCLACACGWGGRGSVGLVFGRCVGAGGAGSRGCVGAGLGDGGVSIARLGRGRALVVASMCLGGHGTRSLGVRGVEIVGVERRSAGAPGCGGWGCGLWCAVVCVCGGVRQLVVV